MQVYMAMDPYDFRILAQDRPIVRSTALPRGPEGEGWPRRHITVPDGIWQQLLSGQVSVTDQDVLHVQWWNDARLPGDPLWPDLPRGPQ